MKNATRIFVSTFGAIMALAGIEHGIGEVLQGNVAPEGIMILSWPESEFFKILSGEPAMTIIPNLLITGILAILFSLVLLVWAAFFVQRKNGALVMILLSIAMLLSGGGIFPPFFGVLIGAVAFKIHSPLAWWRSHLSPATQGFLRKLWPWSYAACIVSWFALLPCVPALEYFFGVDSVTVTLATMFFVLTTLLLTILSGFAYDIQAQANTQTFAQDSGIAKEQRASRKGYLA